MGSSDIARAFFKPLVYMVVVWALTWLLVGGLKLPPQSGSAIALYIIFVLCILVERITSTTSSKGGR